MISTERLYRLFSDACKEMEISQAKLSSVVIGKHNSSFMQAIRRGSMPAIDRVVKACEYLSINLEEVIGFKVADFSAESKNNKDFRLEHALIPRLNVCAAAGHGAVNEHEQVSSHLAFRREWLREGGLEAGKCAIIEVSGDSMESLLSDGEVVLVDLTKHQPAHNQMLVVRTEDGLLIKKAQKVDKNLWILASENTVYAPIRLRPSARIIGHVANWKAGRINDDG